ncbi:putative quinol monooxygenase [Pseudomonas putida]|uniref:putative quinol monooxygenase n=1 Tax=Pseudomonas putida TaxID=303 RepID=UPI0024E0AE8F|nr:antibiotic biosynthesis monooxygenase [Pseudomonas putida]HDS0962766.1 antibiotic biosynthesis monooxygenase [Pseudomonas putida]HDS0990000.1 antibiotic biosynthesis monooxygenase [Pseudomonas putida]
MTLSNFAAAPFNSKPRLQPELKDAPLTLLKAGPVEPVCIRYQLAQSSGDPEIFFLVECWASEQALKVHQQTSNFLGDIKKNEELTVDASVHFARGE